VIKPIYKVCVKRGVKFKIGQYVDSTTYNLKCASCCKWTGSWNGEVFVMDHSTKDVEMCVCQSKPKLNLDMTWEVDILTL